MELPRSIHPFVHSSVRSSEFCGCHNSTSTGPIHSKSSSFEPSGPVDVQTSWSFAYGAHTGMPMGIIRTPGILQMPELRQIPCKSSSLEPSLPVTLCPALGLTQTPGILQMPELSNHWADFLQIKFIGTVLACRCATSWSLAHQSHMGMPTGIMSSLGMDARTQQPLGRFTSNKLHWNHLCQLTCNVMVICPSRPQWYSYAHQSHKGMCTV